VFRKFAFAPTAGLPSRAMGLACARGLIQEWYNGREALIADGVAGGTAASAMGSGGTAISGRYGKAVWPCWVFEQRRFEPLRN